MAIKNQEKILVVLADESLEKNKVRSVLQFCISYSDEIVMCQLGRKSQCYRELSNFELIRCEKTTQTHCTSGPLTSVYHIKSTSNIKQLLYELDDIYAPICLDQDDEVLEDPGFYHKGELLCSICSHEKIGRLFLNESQYREFYSLRIPHDIYCDNEEITLEEKLEEYAYQERETLSIMDSNLESIPSNIGKLTRLKKLEIFCHQLKYLPPTLESLTGLEYLRITGNKVENLGFDISKMKSLKGLDLGGMPLKSFPMGITELIQLQELYLSGLKVEEVNETIMRLINLKVLALPEIDTKHYSSLFIDFTERLKPKIVGIPLKDILGEEAWGKIIESNDYIIVNGDKWT